MIGLVMQTDVIRCNREIEGPIESPDKYQQCLWTNRMEEMLPLMVDFLVPFTHMGSSVNNRHGRSITLILAMVDPQEFPIMLLAFAIAFQI